MTSKETKQQVDALLDKYEALDGRQRVQTHRNAIAIAAVEVLVQHRRSARAAVPDVAAGAKAAEAPRWPVTRVRKRWNGECQNCHKAAMLGQLVRWDPKSGRPSAWQHVSCTDPFGGGRQAREPGLFA